MNPADTLRSNQQRFTDGADLTGAVVSRESANAPGVPGRLGPAPAGGQQLPAGTTPLNLVSGNPGRTTVAAMPTAGVAPETNVAVNDKIAAKVRDGAALYQRIAAGDPPPRTKENAALLMWYLQALGSSKAGPSNGEPDKVALFKSGAFTVADPGNRLKDWLTGFNVYTRASSHLKGFQSLEGCRPHGLDIRGVETPNERRTILFAKIPNPANKTGAPDDPPLLFFKMEEHGCRGLSFKGTGEKTGVWQGIKRFFANLRDFAGHSLGFLRSLTERGGLQGQDNRERVNAGILRPYENLLNTLPGEPADVVTAVRTTLDDPKRKDKTGGIHLMVDKLNAALGQLAAARTEAAGDPRRTAGIDELKNQLDATLDALRARGDHSELRFGREIILMPEDMVFHTVGTL
jgi:hypothetical protein